MKSLLLYTINRALPDFTRALAQKLQNPRITIELSPRMMAKTTGHNNINKNLNIISGNAERTGNQACKFLNYPDEGSNTAEAGSIRQLSDERIQMTDDPVGFRSVEVSGESGILGLKSSLNKTQTKSAPIAMQNIP